ncbi:hypothetical protein GF420_14785 [candidate division GN15 bacterium]|nr:hypothetical protein [candidate division GN15 bacterium]
MANITDETTFTTVTDDIEQHREVDRWLEMFSIFIHDLESPLASVKYLLNKLESGAYDPNRDGHRSLVHSSRVAVDRAESILYDIMAVARAGKAGIPLELTTLVPDALLREAIDLASASAAEHRIDLTYRNNAGDIAIEADPKLLKRVVDNLIYNGIRHTPAGGTVAVYTEPGEKCLFVHVKDSGPGLGDIEPSLLFEKYGQLQLRSEGKHRGVGLGLYFCKLAATGMGGTIIADDHPKGGAVFSIKLPKAEV